MIFTVKRISRDVTHSTLQAVCPPRGILGGVPASRLWPNQGLDDLILVASTEVNTDEDRAAYVHALKEIL